MLSPRKIPFKFEYHFECDDTQSRGHKLVIADREVGVLLRRAEAE